MKVTFETTDKCEIRRILQSLDMALAMWKFAQYLREKLKYGNLSEEIYTVYEDIQTEFFEILDNEDINLDALTEWQTGNIMYNKDDDELCTRCRKRKAIFIYRGRVRKDK